MHIATPGSLIEKLYRDWRSHEGRKNRLALELEQCKATPEHLRAARDMDLDDLVERLAEEKGAAAAGKWALSTVLHAHAIDLHMLMPSNPSRTVVNWTYGDQLALDYHAAVMQHQRAERRQAAAEYLAASA